MDVIATVVAASGLSDETVSAIAGAVDLLAIEAHSFKWIDRGFAGDFSLTVHDNDLVRVRQAFDQAIAQIGVMVDVIVQRTADRAKRLLIADMDSTMITVECIDELADYAGIKAQIAAITERAMRGELDFRAALTERVALLAGLPETVIAQCLAERVRPMAGARTLVQTLDARGVRCVLVSGGFTCFADPVAAMLGFRRTVANVLEIADGVLTGRVIGPIVDSGTKLATLNAECAALNIGADQVLAIGDGANDIAMIAAAGLGIAYHGHPAAIAAADAAVQYGDHRTILWALGIPSGQWATA